MISDLSREHLGGLARRTGFGSAVDLIFAEARECVYFANAADRWPEDERPGASRIGGLPDLPEGVDWPHGVNLEDQPWGFATFLAQFDLADLPEVDGLPLPRRGGLWLFARRWGYTHAPMVAIYDAAPRNLRPRPAPEGDWPEGGPRAFRATPLRFRRGVSLPLYRRSFREALEAVGDDEDGLHDLVLALPGGESDGQVGGYSSETELDPYRHLAFRELGRLDYLEADGYASVAEYEEQVRGVYGDEPPAPGGQMARWRPMVEWIEGHRAEIDANAASWRLLFRFDRNGEADLDIGDAMALEVFGRSSDLAALKFDSLSGEMPQTL
jgi:hypothetical protein